MVEVGDKASRAATVEFPACAVLGERSRFCVERERSSFSLDPYKLVRGLVCQKPVAANWLWSICFHILRCDKALECIE